MPATIRKGSTGADVLRWQGLLNAAGFAAPQSGTFDHATEAATRAWQGAKGLAADGVVGRASWDAMLGTSELQGPSGPPPYTIASVKGLADKTSNLFRWRLLGLAERLGANADHIAAVMSSESAGTFSPSIRNPNGGATGLIQFMPATARRLGTTTDALAAMTAEDQLRYVERYLRPFEGRLHSPTDVYMAIFVPAFVGRSASSVVGRKDDDSDVAPGLTYNQVYKANSGFDRNKDGEILVGEVGAVVEGLLSAAQGRPRVDVFPEESTSPITGAMDSKAPGSARVFLFVAVLLAAGTAAWIAGPDAFRVVTRGGRRLLARAS